MPLSDQDVTRLNKVRKNTRRFFGLEKRNAKFVTLSKLMVCGTITNHPKIISQHVAQFYQNLYSSVSAPSHIDSFFSILMNTNKIK